VALFSSVKDMSHRCISRVGGFVSKYRKSKFIFFSVPAIILAILSVGVTAYFDLPPGAQVLFDYSRRTEALVTNCSQKTSIFYYIIFA